MPTPLTRRRFLASAAAISGGALLPWRAWAGGMASGQSGGRAATFFEVVLAGRAIDGAAIAGDAHGKRVRVLVGAAGGSSNSMVYVDAGGSMLVDVSTAPMGRRMVEDAIAVGGPFGAAAEGRTAVVVNTHHHADHTGGNFALSRFGPRPTLLMHSVCDERVRASVERYQAAAVEGVRAAAQHTDAQRREMALASATGFAQVSGGLTADDFGASETFDSDRHELVVGESPVVLHFFGAGHTDNDTVVELPEENVVHCGDLLFSQMHPYFADGSGATCLGWIESVRRIIDLCDDQTVVVPGHGPVCAIDELHRQHAYLQQLWEAVETEIRSGTPRADVVQKSWPFMDGLGFTQIRGRAIAAVYDEAMAAR